MSDGIYVDANGFAEAIYARTPAWHLKGEVKKDGDLTSDDIRPLIDWEPKLKALTWVDHLGRERISTSAVAVVRSDTEAELGAVGPNYSPYGQLEGLDLFDTLMMDGLMKYEAAFALHGGQEVCIVAKVPGVHEVAEGDDILPFVMQLFNHVGKRLLITLPTAIRPVCANTIGMALAAGAGQILRVRHSGDVHAKMELVRDALSDIHSSFTDHTKLARKLSQVKVTSATWKPYLDALFPVPQITDPDFTQRKHNNVRETRRQVTHNLVNDPAQQVPSTRHSWYAAYNAVSQWVDHREYKGKDTAAKKETRFRVSNLGSGQDLKQKAFRSALVLSEN